MSSRQWLQLGLLAAVVVAVWAGALLVVAMRGGREIAAPPLASAQSTLPTTTASPAPLGPTATLPPLPATMSPTAAAATPSALPTLDPAPSAIPTTGPTFHVVARGETLYAIGRHYAVDVETILRGNNLANPNLIFVGQSLLIPDYAPPTATPLPSMTPTPGPSATPTATATPLPPGALPPLATPTALAGTESLPLVWPFGPYREQSPLPIPPNLVAVALLGAEGGTSGWRTDSIQLVLLNPDTQRIGIIGLPRDAWVAIPGYGYNRINTVDFLGERTRYPGGGPALLKRTLWENFGLPMHYFARVRFGGFIEIIDTLGGVEVTVDCEIADIFPHPTNPGALVHMDLYPGVNHLDGTMALLYSRSRLSTSDFDRARRQQSVMKGLFKQFRSTETIGRIPQLYEQFNETVQTDMGLPTIVALARHAVAVEPENVTAMVVDHRLMRDWLTPEGAMVLLPNEELLQARLRDFFETLNAPPAAALAEAARVVVVNQTAYPTWGEVAVSRVEWSGGTVTAVEAVNTVGSQTRIISYGPGTEDTLAALAATLGIDTATIVAGDPNSPERTHGEDIALFVGYDFQLCRR